MGDIIDRALQITVTGKLYEALLDHASRKLTNSQKYLYLIGYHVSNEVPWYELDNVAIKFEHHTLPDTVIVMFN